MTRIRKTVAQLAPYTPGEQINEPGVVKLNTNESPYPPSPRVRAALEAMAADRLRLYPDPLARELRARAAALHGCAPEQVFAGNGCDEVLSLCVRAFADADGSVGYFNPSYSLYPVLADIRGLEKRPVELGPDFAWRMPPGYACSLFLMTNPNAPTGIQYPKAAVRAFCERFPGVVFIDEAYVDFARDQCMDLALSLPNVIAGRTLSKAYSLAGLRVGYAVGSRELIDALFKIKDSYNVNMISQKLALAALEDQPYLRANVERVRATRERLAAWLSGRGFAVCPSETNFLWAKPPDLDAAELYARLKARRILIRYFDGPRTRDFVRISIGSDVEIDRLTAAMEEVTAG